jgi:hypothetical protein
MIQDHLSHEKAGQANERRNLKDLSSGDSVLQEHDQPVGSLDFSGLPLTKFISGANAVEIE